MEDKRYCPECNAPLEGDEAFCDNCGAALKKISTPIETEENSGTIASSRESDGDDISRNNVMGNINKSTTNNTSNSVTTNKVDNSTSNVTTNSSVTDNSVVHNNNTTIVMGGKNEAEFCEVCGNPFDGKHARCPKCGKSICFDCKVKGKNRCIECEKKAVNEYRLAFQELLMTTQSNIGVSGRQIMNRKAQELDVEDKKKAIEEELSELYKPQTKPQQPTVIVAPEHKPEPQKQSGGSSQTPERPNRVEKEPEQKGVGALSGRKPLVSTPKSSGGNSKTGIYILIGAIVIIAAYFLFVPRGGEKSSIEKTETPIEATVEKENTPNAEQPKQQIAETPKAQQAPQENIAKPEEPKSQPAVPVTDSDYEAGMKAYNAGNGLEAIKSFKASGSAQSFYMLGVIYESGCGNVSKNAMMARQNFKKAAQMGSTEAKAKL